MVGSQRLDGPFWWRALAAELTDAGETLGASSHLRRESSDERIDRRHPFLFDLELLQTVLAEPPELQFDPVRDRALLRDGLLGHIPEAVRTRHAKSFFTDLLAAGLAADGALLAAGPARRRRAGARVRARRAAGGAAAGSGRPARHQSRAPALAGRPGGRLAAGAGAAASTRASCSTGQPVARYKHLGALARVGVALEVALAPWQNAHRYFFRTGTFSSLADGARLHILSSTVLHLRKETMEKDTKEYEAPRIEDHGDLADTHRGLQRRRID